LDGIEALEASGGFFAPVAGDAPTLDACVMGKVTDQVSEEEEAAVHQADDGERPATVMGGDLAAQSADAALEGGCGNEGASGERGTWGHGL
jgi:hypothetical protein